MNVRRKGAKTQRRTTNINKEFFAPSRLCGRNSLRALTLSKMITNDKHPILAREGWGHVGYALSAAVLVHWLLGGWWALPLWIFALFVVQFFRDPARVIPSEPNIVVCPADGRVIAVDEVEDPYLKRPARRVSIFMNVFNVHSNRTPVAGEVKERWYNPGSFFKDRKSVV